MTNPTSKHVIKHMADLLEAAAEELEVHGWTKNTAHDEITGKMCLYGAIRFAYAGHFDDLLMADEMYLNTAINTVAFALPTTVVKAASYQINHSPIFWNDEICQSKEEAIELLKKAAKLPHLNEQPVPAIETPES